MRSTLRTRASRHGQDGQTLVEVALAIPVFILVLVAIIDIGRLVYTNEVLSQAAREGARLAAAEASRVGISESGCVADASAITAANPGAHVCPPDLAALKSNVADAVNRMAVSLPPISAIHISCNSGVGSDLAPSGAWTETTGGNGCDDGAGNPIGATDELVSVRAELTYVPLTPVIDLILDPITLSGSATMVIT